MAPRLAAPKARTPNARIQVKRLIVRDFGGSLLVRVLVHSDDGAVYVISDACVDRARNGEDVEPVGFPRADAFKYDEAALSDPSRLQPWTEDSKTDSTNARSLYQHVERYLAGCLNDAALEHWQLAIGRAIELGAPFDLVLGQMGQLYVRKFGLPMMRPLGGVEQDLQPCVGEHSCGKAMGFHGTWQWRCEVYEKLRVAARPDSAR